MTSSQLGVWPPLPPTAYLRRPRSPLPFPLDEPGCLLFRRARHGLFHGLGALGLRPGDEILMPAYHHGSEVEAVVRAGMTCKFYEATATLEPDAGELGPLLGPNVRALYLIHYLGFPQDGARWRAWCRERGLLLIEDAAQGWLGSIDGQPLGSFGDLAIFCPSKMVGVPDSGILLSNPSPRIPANGRSVGAYRLARRHAAWVMSRSALVAAIGVRFEGGWVPPDRELGLGDLDAPRLEIVPFLLPRLLDPDPAVRRRSNYRMLLDELADHVPQAFTVLPDGASPFAFPVQSRDKADLLLQLKRHHISPLDFWAWPHPSLPLERFPKAAQLRAQVVGLPVHQELRPQDLERITAAVTRRH